LNNVELDNGNIKAKFGIIETGIPGVTGTVNRLSQCIKAGGLTSGVIQLGDWIDLEGGLTVTVRATIPK
jgi:hypothetical protein